MENLNLGLENSEQLVRYDLKGSENKRYIIKEQKIGKVLLDTNFKLDFNSRPIPLNFKIWEMLKYCIHNDTLFLNKQNVVDYSLLLILNKKEKWIRVGIIDYC